MEASRQGHQQLGFTSEGLGCSLLTLQWESQGRELCLLTGSIAGLSEQPCAQHIHGNRAG